MARLSFLALPKTREAAYQRTLKRKTDIYTGKLPPDPYPTRAEALAAEDHVLELLTGRAVHAPAKG